MLALLIACSLDVTTAYAQATDDVCSNTPATSQRIACTEDSTSSDAIDIDAEGVDIDTTAADEPGIKASHAGNAKIDITVKHKAEQGQVTQSTIDTTGAGSHGIFGKHTGTGDVDINTVLGEITTTGSGSHGISVEHTGATGDVSIDTNSTTIRTEEQGAYGIHADTDAVGRLDVEVSGRSITTTGAMSHGVHLRHDGTGAIDLDILNGPRIMATGYGVNAEHYGTGDIIIKSKEGVDVETSGQLRHGIFGDHQGTGNITLDVKGVSGMDTITTTVHWPTVFLAGVLGKAASTSPSATSPSPRRGLTRITPLASPWASRVSRHS